MFGRALAGSLGKLAGDGADGRDNLADRLAPEYVHLPRDRVRAALELLAKDSAGIAEVLPVERFLAEGLFGRNRFRPSCGAGLATRWCCRISGIFIWWRQPGLIEN